MRLLVALLATIGLTCAGSSSSAPLDAGVREGVQSGVSSGVRAGVGAAPAGNGINVHLIIGDDLGTYMISSYRVLEGAYTPSGGSATATPTLDTFASNAMRFTMAVTEQVCTPTKCAVMTGMGMWRSQCINSTGDGLSNDHSLLPEVIPGTAVAFGKLGTDCTNATAGTACTVGANDDRWRQGWTYTLGKPGNTMIDYGDYTLTETWNVPPYKDTTLNHTVHATERVIDDFEAYHATAVEQHFYWIHPHDAHLARHFYADGAPYDATGCDVTGTPGPRTNDECVQAQVQHLDTVLGTIIGDELDCTVDYCIFMGDDGTDPGTSINALTVPPWNDNWHDASKGYPEDPGALVPLMIAGPGITGGTVRGELVAIQDLFPTIIEMMGGYLPAGQALDGISLLTLLEGGAAPARRFIATGRPTQSIYSIRDNRSPYMLIHDTSLGNDDNIFFAPAQLAADRVGAGDIYDYLLQMLYTQADNQFEDKQDWCADGADGGPVAFVCEDFETAEGTCITDTSIDAEQSAPLASACSSTTDPLDETQSMRLVSNNDAYEWHALGSTTAGTGCTDTGVCYADMLFRYTGATAVQRALLEMFETDGTTSVCEFLFTASTGLVEANTRSTAGTGTTGTIAAGTTVKLRAEWNNTTDVCTLYSDATTGTHGTTAVTAETDGTPADTEVAELHAKNFLGVTTVEIDQLEIVGYEPDPAGDFDNAIEGLGYSYAQNFESASTCTQLALLGYGGPAEGACALNSECPDGDYCFGLEGVTGDWWYDDAIVCDAMADKTCEIEFEFRAATGSGLTNSRIFEVYNTGGTTVQIAINAQATVFFGFSSNLFTNQASTYAVLEATTYKVRIHLTEDGANDSARVWLDPAEGAFGGGELAALEDTASAALDPAEIWIGGGSGATNDYRIDNLRWRLLP